MIEKVWFRNFMALKRVDLDLARFTVLVGPNASGKTSVLRALSLLGQLGDNLFSKVFLGNNAPELLLTQGATEPMGLGLAGTWGPVQERIQGRLDLQVEKGFSGWHPAGSVSWGTMSIAQLGLSIKAISTAFGSVLAATKVLRLDPHALAEASFDEYPPQMSEDGAGLPSVLAELAVTSPEVLEEIQQALREIIPSITRLRFNRKRLLRQERVYKTVDNANSSVEGEPSTYHVPTDMLRERMVWGHELLVDTRSGQRLPTHLISEGTLLVLGLLTAILGPTRPNLLLLDDLDRGLHPAAQVNLIGLFRRLLDRFPALQIVATSHSPYLLDALQFEEVRLVTPDEEGAVLIGPLTGHPDFKRWQDLMAPGELWSAVGEGWLRKTQKADHGG